MNGCEGLDGKSANGQIICQVDQLSLPLIDRDIIPPAF
jgi:hypothetical protein